MEASPPNERPTSLLVALAASLIILALLAAIKAIESLDLPLSRHAHRAHEGQLGATQIRDLVNQGKCSPVEAYHCPVPGNNHAKVICRLKGDIWAGLIIGLEGNQQAIVTGYPASRTYWLGAVARDGCTPIAFGAVP